MKHLTSLLIIVPLLSIFMVKTAQGQTEEEFTQEFQRYAENYGIEAGKDYAMNRLFQITEDSVLAQYYWALAFQQQPGGGTPCVRDKKQLCDYAYQVKKNEIAALSTAAMVACALTIEAVPAFALCAAAVAVQHKARMDAADAEVKACYLRAYIECIGYPSPTPTPTPGHCGILAPVKIPGPEEILPDLAACEWYEAADPCLCPPISPIVVDVSGNGFNLTNLDDGVMFNMTGLGRQPLGWTKANSDDAFLALDLNANGLIDNGGELFGNFTPQTSPPAGQERNGFRALALFDFNADGVINSVDPVFSELRLWQDRNHNGVSEAGELHRLADLGLTTLDLKYKQSKKVDGYGNEFRYRAKVEDIHGAQLGRWAWDVFLMSARPRGVQ